MTSSSNATTNNAPTECTDLVLFSYCNPFTEALKLKDRLFRFNDTDIKIQQQWEAGGKGGTTIGFGASVYDCSIVLSYFLCSIECEKNLQNKSIIELGCGPALASVVCGIILNTSIVIATDGDLSSVNLATHNIMLNNNGNKSDKVCSMQLFWGNRTHINDALQKLTTTTTTKFDFIILSDVVALVYTEAFDALLQTLEELSNENTVIYLCYQKRHFTENIFFEKLKDSKKYDVKKLPRSSIHQDFRHLPIFIYQIIPIINSTIKK